MASDSAPTVPSVTVIVERLFRHRLTVSTADLPELMLRLFVVFRRETPVYRVAVACCWMSRTGILAEVTGYSRNISCHLGVPRKRTGLKE